MQWHGQSQCRYHPHPHQQHPCAVARLCLAAPRHLDLLSLVIFGALQAKSHAPGSSVRRQFGHFSSQRCCNSKRISYHLGFWVRANGCKKRALHASQNGALFEHVWVIFVLFVHFCVYFHALQKSPKLHRIAQNVFKCLYLYSV